MLGRSAPSSGGIARIIQRHASDAAYETTSTRYVTASPVDAISSPPIAGPAIIPTLPRTTASDAAAGNSRFSTRRGSRDSIAGRRRPLTADIHAATRYKRNGDAPLVAMMASVALPAASATSVTIAMRHRSTASAMTPPMNAVARSGTSSTSPRRPTENDDPVRRYIWYGSAT